MLAVVAKGLRGLKEKVAFVGGATIDLYVTYPADAASRPTDDVDALELATRGSITASKRKPFRGLSISRKGPIAVGSTVGSWWM